MPEINLLDTEVMLLLHAIDILKERGQDTLLHIGYKMEVDRVNQKLKDFAKKEFPYMTFDEAQ